MPGEAHHPHNVVSDDPSLSREANRLLTDELREATGSDSADIPDSRTVHNQDTHATHGRLAASVIDARLGLIVTGLVLLIVIGLVAAGGSWWILRIRFRQVGGVGCGNGSTGLSAHDHGVPGPLRH